MSDFPPWIKDGGKPQKQSDKPGVADLYQSPNVFINNIPAVLYAKPEYSNGVAISLDAATVALLQIDGDGITDSNKDSRLNTLNQKVQDAVNSGVVSSSDVAHPIAATTVSSVTIVNSGTDITVIPTITFSGGGNNPTQATATAVISDGFVTAITLTSPGANYTQVPTVTSSNPSVVLTAVMAPTPAPPVIPPTANNSYKSAVSSPTNFDQYTQDNIPYDTLMLTANTSLARFTTKATLWAYQPKPFGPNATYGPGAAGDNKHIKAQYGLTVPQILTNLADLALNIWEPLIAKYPGMIITNTFRQGPPGGSMQQAQHGTGQAFDAQLPGASYEKYYEICCWMRDNLPVGQLLQERSAASPSKTWIHCSYENKKYGIVVPKINKVANLDLTLKSGQFIVGIHQYV